ncbi:MAG: SDR family oxidoreductase [Planctomycetes bacterium]|nr:SDR family oxidoreductase [Planctomycetota bacterium]
MSRNRFQNKVALVTGGNSGIGLAAAQAFAKEGARVAIAGRDPETLKQAHATLGANAIAIQADVSKLADIDRVLAQVKKEAGRIDALFVNAGVGHFAPIEASDEAFFDKQFATNVKGAYFTIQKALPLMPKGSSIVINASSVVNLGMPNASVYAATKAAVASLARTLTMELAPRGIRINVVNPGPIETPIFERMGLPAEALKEMGAQIVSQVPLRRFGSPEDIAAAVLYLSSDEASYVHGTSLAVDGGMTAL